MAEQTPPPSSNGVDAPEVTRKKQRRISWIWLVPIVALLAGLSLVVRTWMQTGPEISIQFNTAEGIEVGKTQVRYKDVVVGTVHSIRFNDDRSKVIVQAELVKDAAGLATEGTNFWVVRPRLGISGVSGLGTLLSGAYIGVDAVDGAGAATSATKFEFVGLETPPPVTHDRDGKRFVLKAHDLGSLDIGSPVYFRRINVGRVIGYELDESGNAVNVEVFIDSPNDKFVTRGARFWNASGVDLSVDGNGLKLHTQSLVSLALGGVAFAPINLNDSGAAEAGSEFQLYASETDAKANPDGDPVPIRMRFDQSVRGLSVGATIDFQGIALGEVTRITVDFDSNKKRFFAMVDASLYPERLGSVYDRVHERALESGDDTEGKLLASMIKHGLRAQLRTANLLTGQLYIVLAHFPKADPVEFHITDPVVIPTIPGNLEQLQQQITNIVDRIDKIPFDQIGRDLRTTLSSTSRLMSSLDKTLAPEARETLRAARKSIDNINQLLANDAALPANAERAMQELARAARSLRTLADYLQANPEALIRGRGDDPLPGATRN
ncbi:PqiB family protein [Bordetella petrii]|uniref:Membrane protein n=1 Tax=Bordetella petrii (strain ATCC BAA-461 / DSM 12804 / CCUG 43448 / CIP 107267 / Se-1111R) TaxID=340100 RepID=A9IPY7_BORPD|nr:MlaD family protein [Bordetella petrii]CAP42999.1 putative membrane protein [Bordetella petrii]